jgi:hypothetical protein
MGSLCSLCVCVSLPIVVRQRLDKQVSVVMNTHATMEKMSDAAVLSVRSVSL